MIFCAENWLWKSDLDTLIFEQKFTDKRTFSSKLIHWGHTTLALPQDFSSIFVSSSYEFLVNMSFVWQHADVWKNKNAPSESMTP